MWVRACAPHRASMARRGRWPATGSGGPAGCGKGKGGLRGVGSAADAEGTPGLADTQPPPPLPQAVALLAPLFSCPDGTPDLALTLGMRVPLSRRP